MKEIFAGEFAGRKLSITARYLAEQADGAALVTYGDTMVLVTVVSLKTAREGLDFLPLTVDYQEMTYAAGKIPGGFFKREGRPNEREILTSRMIDRSIRPLIPKGYYYETQIVANVLSLDTDNDPAVAAMIGASAALEMSDVPFKGPVAGIRVGRVGGELVCNPGAEALKESDFNIFLTGRKITPGPSGRDFDVNLVMLEGEANEVAEEDLVAAINTGLEAMRPIIALQEQLRREIGKEKRSMAEVAVDEGLEKLVAETVTAGLQEAYQIPRKLERYAMIDALREKAVKTCAVKAAGADDPAPVADPVLVSQVIRIFETLDRKILREKILKEKRRIDGRSFTDIRPISAEVGLLPRVHGSALFNRGETQALASMTLGTSSDEQRIDFIGGEERRTFILHYNFPPYSVGEAKRLGSPGRREIGHGNLARRALAPVLPGADAFPYTIRIVSEILSSNGSSSMATVCGGCLSLMDGGVPIKAPVGGIAMGLLSEGDDVVILSDILGDEDHAGDMDFKVCGTKNGVTAMQMDIKIDNLTEDILKRALRQAREGRIHIIDKMLEALAAPRADISPYAPRITTVKVKPEKVRDVIGSGGKNIRQIVSETGVTIDVEDDGTVTIASVDAEAAARAVAMVRWLTEEAEIGRIYTGTVKKVVDFGAFVEILPGTEGLVHISQLAKNRVNKVTDVVNEGDEIMVKVIEIDKQGKIRLSRKEALGENVS
ncbi:MAG TPA: polyribonucleotide nucleotidyltransferase [Syntrophales bacterium]|jgi:polyribonucleotide nucleotidyltransferase|nr:polyribonucleotide nucleotidyltransferase [Syntrophales bacterium]HOU77801.1 polyribonucleotide nucleotidyltransferase [Syntrophales bacterium]HPC32988.1 polyribonucleotide nucleotidyltransferase [Syntrophales bacterium]HQG34392.1 polyribonucleotide nucleotidyltransferase [Syntrophales bacterium]HQI36132.1 polyribonucleotide nucleotidyltransferase [Syntrophales bacterium]